MRNRPGLPIAAATYLLPVVLLGFYLSLDSIKDVLGRSLDHSVVSTGCGLVCLGLSGASYLVAVAALVLIALRYSRDRASLFAAVGGLVFAVVASVTVFAMHLAEEFGGPWVP